MRCCWVIYGLLGWWGVSVCHITKEQVKVCLMHSDFSLLYFVCIQCLQYFFKPELLRRHAPFLMIPDFLVKTKKPIKKSFSIPPSVLQWSWTAVDVCPWWPCVLACCQRPAWPRPVKSFDGASRARGHLPERPPHQTETNVTHLRDDRAIVCARERKHFMNLVHAKKGLFRGVRQAPSSVKNRSIFMQGYDEVAVVLLVFFSFFSSWVKNSMRFLCDLITQ